MSYSFIRKLSFLLVYLCATTSAILAQKTVTGKVTGVADGVGLPGVNVTVSGTNSGAITDNNGHYIIQVPPDAKSLNFSFIGYAPQTISINNKQVIHVALVAAAKGLGEVVVVGYGVQNRRDVTGTISSVKGNDIKNLPVSDAAQAIQGRVTGVDIIRSNSTPGSEPSIRIRGTGTLNNADPLVIIDGVPATGISDVNPNDIAAMEILKDASSSAIYGTRAANGVIIITTKKGNYGEKLKTSVNLYQGVSNTIRYIPMLTAPELVQLKQERYTNDGVPVDAFWKDPYYAVQRTDWQRALLKFGKVTNADISLRGGNNSSNYMLSGGYYNENGIITNSYFKRYTARINSEHKLGKRFKIGENLQLTFKQYSGPNTFSAQTGLIFSALRFNPAIPVRNPDGSYGSSKANNELGDINNPVYIAEARDTWNKNYRMLASVYGELEILDGLTLRGNYGFDGNLNTLYGFNPKVLDQTRTRDHAELWNGSETTNTQLSEIFLTYDKVLNQLHHVTVTGGYSQQTSNGSFFNTERWYYNDESPDQRVLSNGNVIRDAAGNFIPANAIASGFVRSFYGFKDKYLLTLTFRADGSSRFAPDKRWGYFPAFSAGWRVSDESFFKENVKVVSNLKITGGWGQLGNQNVTEFQYLAPIDKNRRYNFGDVQYTGVWNSRLANPNITWEKAAMTNISIEAGFLQNKLNTTLTWFNKNTRDMLVPAPEVDMHGTAAIPDRNIGQLNNKGWEVEVNYQNSNDNFHYNISANASFIKNEVTKLYDPNTYISSSLYGRQGQEISRTYVGQPVASFYGWRTNGIYQTQEEINSDPNTSKDPNKTTIKPGDVRFLDTNNDGIINEQDRVNLGSPNPKMTYGIQASAGYKGFDLSLSFTGVSGVKLYNADKMQGMDANYPFNMYADALNRWHGAGTSNTVPRMTLDNANQNNRTSDRFVENGDYFSLRNIALGYTVPSKIWGRATASSLRIYAAAQNLFILTNYSGLSPMIGYNGNKVNGVSDGNKQRGVDVAAYPQARTFTFGATFNF